MTQPSVETAQSGKAADAVRILQTELSGDYSEMRSAEIQLTEAILSAHAVTVSGRTALQDIQRQLIEAINNPVAALDTPAGERHFLMFLRSKVAQISDIVDTGALTDEDHAALTRALGSGYLLPVAEREAVSTPAGTSGASTADQGAGMLPAIGSALGALPQAAQGAATAPAQGAGGLAGAATPLAGLASGLMERGGEPDTDEAAGSPVPDETEDEDESQNRDTDAEESDTDDRHDESRGPGDRQPPDNGPAQTPASPPAVGEPMTNIRITPSVLNQVATRHDSVADEIAVARSAGSDILASVATHGPIMHQFKAAANDVVARRDAAFADHEAAHRAAADNLRSIAVRFSDQEEINASELRLD